MPSPVSRLSIDSHPQKALIIQRIMDGLSGRQVVAGLEPPVPQTTLQRYKTNVIKPIVASVAKNNRLSLRKNDTFESLEPVLSDSKLVKEVVAEAVNAPVLSIFRQRLEHLNSIIDRTLTKAESAVRLATDKDGNQVVVGADIGVMAPLLNQAHKNVEMLGRATGELEPQGGGGVSIQILCPIAGATPEEMPRISYADANAIEGSAAPAIEAPEFEDISLIQA